jgi:hypothetical protein
MQKILTIGIFVLFFGCAGKEAAKEPKKTVIEKDTFTKVTAEFWGETATEQLKESSPRRTFSPPAEFAAAATDTILWAGTFQTVLAGEKFDKFAAVYINPSDGKAYKAGLTESTQAQGIAIDTALAINDTLQIMTNGIVYNYAVASTYNSNLYSIGDGAISFTSGRNSQKIGYVEGFNLIVEIEPFLSEIETIKRKFTDETKTANTTLATDSDLFASLESSSSYAVELVVWINATSSTMGYKYGTAYSGTLSGSQYYRVHTVPGDVSGIATDEVSTGLISSTAVSGATSGAALVRINYIVHTTTAGVFSFRWAQNTSDAGGLSVMKGSHIKYIKI